MSETNVQGSLAEAPKAAVKRVEQGVKLRGYDKVSRNPVKIIATDAVPRKPDWIRVRLSSSPSVEAIKQKLRKLNLHSVCEEASCPNLSECFSHGTATFMIMGDICTRRCPFCDVAHGRPNALDENEPTHLAQAIAEMNLKYVVITSVDRDDLRDGGAGHFAKCISESRKYSPNLKIEVLVPDFRGRMDVALDILRESPPDVFNHNLETVPRLYKQARPGADYAWSLLLLKRFKEAAPDVPTKSGLMLGIGEEIEEVKQVMRDLRAHNTDMLTLGQYLAPSKDHLPVVRFVHPDEFKELADYGYEIGFKQVASGPLVRSSYHADKQAAGETIS
ncbi:lipoic acid synthetase [Hahella chejuensis KCTC 2396]|uniref:Lipoyl synthase n=1 Tax=Hahella chejuensis (strain KCTC 2396) TaxID=349521 RepID=LIPA_HAHCH|nr:lipoyl synthase [Hahella chejuensis]Q2SA38.1 RecName: Full=Lipoyl synthase; AltName: Full=Lip-syn; Short=LS; AltName: Full=Lipoate synthase; AltName: Full=Lipoic acid synthase; AltName: Full=Sulfur insertion protein LipA [Hahella chejuensis KCTC 2396]ABC32486.1 lipoic acid synthetase [Hahella chejuensis KCTC 2396]